MNGRVSNHWFMVLLTIVILVVMTSSFAAGQDFKVKEMTSVPGKVEFIPGEIIVKFKPGVSGRNIFNINRGHGTEVIYTSPFAGFKRLRIPPVKTVEEMVEIYSKNPNVEYAEPNSICYAFMVPDDPLYSYQWHLDNVEYGGINMESVWDIHTGDPTVIVGVLDTGVAYEDYKPSPREKYYLAPDLAGTNFVAGYDFVNDDLHPNDDEGHGTHVTGTIAQTTNNGVGVAGIAYNCSIMPVKVLDGQGYGTDVTVADGLYFAADNGADVINMSLGWPAGYDPGKTVSDAITYAYTAGVTLVAASGNDGKNTVSYPAAYDDYVIAVGATRYDEAVAYYSNTGQSLDLVAPGGDMYVDQNNDGYGDGVLQQTFGRRTNDWGYWFYQGTSMASPHVAGVAALLIANGTATTPDEVREALQSTAEDKGASDWDPEYGWGIVDAYAALSYTQEPNNPPVAVANGPYTGTEDVAITFNGSGSYDLDSDPLTYTWDFGDGSTGSGVNPTHAYTAGGTYTVTLVVNDGKENSDPFTTTATITEVNDIPVADAGPDQSALAGETVTFEGSDSYDIDDGIAAYDWDFGDETAGSGITTTHAYSIAGTYTVTLKVTDNGGLTAEDTAIVTVTEQSTLVMHVASIDMVLSTRTAGRNTFTKALATVTIVDAISDPVEGATVYGSWIGATSDTDSDVTDATGKVTLESDGVKNPPNGTTYTFTVEDVSKSGWYYDLDSNIETSDSIVSASGKALTLNSLGSSFPNPANPETSIRYSINQSGHVSLFIYNILGQQVRTLVDEVKATGVYIVHWNGMDDSGNSVSSGIYICQFRTGTYVETKTMSLIR